MTGDELIPVEYDGKNYNINTRDIFNNVSDYNVSVLFPNDGINGDNKYDLEQACKILKPYFDNQNAKHGFIISFYNSDNIIEKWLFCKDNIAPKNFMKINTYENPNNYIGVLKKGVYPNKYVIFKGKQFTEQKINLWDEIDKEVSSLNNDQQAILAKDEVYNKLSGELQTLIQEELINSVKDKVANSPRGKELLEKQLNNIRTKKDSIIEEANRELELFKKFQIAAQANPKLTYIEFCKTINNE